jgi:hypothetical protein
VKIEEITDGKIVAFLEGGKELHDYNLQLYEYLLKGSPDAGNRIIPLVNLYVYPDSMETLPKLKVDVLIIQTTGTRFSQFLALKERFFDIVEEWQYKPEAVIALLGEEYLYSIMSNMRKMFGTKFYSADAMGPGWEVTEVLDVTN